MQRLPEFRVLVERYSALPQRGDPDVIGSFSRVSTRRRTLRRSHENYHQLYDCFLLRLDSLGITMHLCRNKTGERQINVFVHE